LRGKNGLQKPIFTLKSTHPTAEGGGGEGLGERKIGFFIKIQFFSPLKPLLIIKQT